MKKQTQDSKLSYSEMTISEVKHIDYAVKNNLRVEFSIEKYLKKTAKINGKNNV